METIKLGECNSPRGVDKVNDSKCDTKKEVSDVLSMPNRNLNYKEVSEKLVGQLKEYLKESGQKGFVVGVSGGIDSALVSTLCAMTGEKVTVMDLPIHQKNDEVNRANNHMNWLQQNFSNIERYSIDLTETFETFKKALPEISDETARYIAYVNSRSRLRAVTLYAIGNEKNAIVAGTGNKVEDYGIGFFTKYGDGAVDISPIGNLYKSEVYEMARFLGVNQEILDARPTDGLHPNGATDEDQIGCSYDELEWAMVQYDEGKRSNNFSGREKEVMEIYSKRHEINAHKMEMPKIFEI
ncbi:MAG: NAD(+) synthase [Candidatus Gracilibacteria bacterium]|nr:NAD(+) synthase [Candidatus Gracilibacteria bacterium]